MLSCFPALSQPQFDPFNAYVRSYNLDALNLYWYPSSLRVKAKVCTMTFKILQDHCLSSRVIVLAVPQTQSHAPRTFLAQSFFTCYIFCQKQISPRYLHGSLSYPFLVVAQMSSYQ